MVSIIIPTYNEATTVEKTLRHLRDLRGNFEVIVADGESTDGTLHVVESLAASFSQPLRCFTGKRHRALQMNQAAKEARGETLIFLHADARLGHDALEQLRHALADASIVGGNFNLVFDGNDVWSRLFTCVNRLRRRLGIYYGDSALFVPCRVFQQLGGFAPIPIMEDYEFVRRLERSGRSVCLNSVVRVSDRRWRVQGVLWTLLSWVWIQGLYSLGVPPARLSRWYRAIRAAPGQDHQPAKTCRVSSPNRTVERDASRSPISSVYP
jgi:rSAM/selenodomain-associated transferase 2